MQESSAHFAASAMLNNLVPSIAHRMVQSDAVEKEFRDAVAAFWNDDRLSAQDTMERFVKFKR